MNPSQPADLMPNAALPPRRPAGLTVLLLGPDPRQRAALKRCLLASFVCLVWLGVEIDAYHRGRMSVTALQNLLLFNGLGLLGFWMALRSGWSLRFEDYALSQPQMVFASLSMAAAYAMVPYTRAAALQVMCLTLVFGMFRLSPREIRRMGLVSAAILLGAVLALHHGGKVSVHDDLLPALATCCVLAGMSVVLGRFSRMREQLNEQKQVLRQTLREVEELAIRDSLTGLFNRRHMQELLAQESLRHARSGTPLTIALVDLDHFKQVNDVHGHSVGDAVLCNAAKVLQDQVRRTDVVGRWGGEEFLMILPDTPVQNALPVLERARAALQATVVSQTAAELRITLSAGLAQRQCDGSVSVMLDAADKALYAAKASGRNRCLVG
jgi:diguanylate cyclase (GGDEF)-like protein